MKAAADVRGAGSQGPRKRALCVLCGLPAAGKSTLARALGQRLRRERGWAVGVVSYDDVMPGFPAGAGAQPSPPRWRSLRRELLGHLERFLGAVAGGRPLSAPADGAALWAAFAACLEAQGLLLPAAPDAQAPRPLTESAVAGPLLLLLDDNFYYRSMRYEVYQLARKHALGFCQLFLDCPLETCLRRNGRRPQALPSETIRLMETRLERPDPGNHAWERRSLTVEGPACSAEASLEVTDLLLTALENPVKYVEENMEQKEADRIICSANVLHRADQTLRRIVSLTMKEAKDEQVLPSSMKLLAEELNKLKAEFLEDLRQGNKKYLCFHQTTDLSDVISDFHYEKDNIVQKYFSKPH
ncbi:L-seryl-tRNA(Sec) kinase [Lepus europaeus]|uniref:L-seryl-tRNA(Sec) kinase n=1 Tax=Lepus europaeus TaxID=9983 RepID=UPI002B496827|nr:L-seryl-tRNA(Sec) kinase [Lepus europaeus]